MTLKQYIRLGDAVKARIIEVAKDAASDKETLKALHTLCLYDASAATLAKAFARLTPKLNRITTSFDVPYSIFDGTHARQVTSLRELWKKDAKDFLLPRAKASYRTFLELRKRFERPKGLDKEAVATHESRAESTTR